MQILTAAAALLDHFPDLRQSINCNDNARSAGSEKPAHLHNLQHGVYDLV